MTRLSLLALLLPALAHAQSSDPSDGPAPRVIELDLEGTRVGARTPGPSATVLLELPPPQHRSLIEVRASFNPAMELSLGEIR